ncbi:MAG: M56 family metallopeptidase [Oscillospiraceae bacterium]|nr:M56 family metallopeptidase [Oscillospiraceae bacterium]
MLETLISSSVLIVVLALLRLALRGRIRPGLQYALWLAVLVRLLVPVSWFESPVGVASVTSEAVAQAEVVASLPVGSGETQTVREITETDTVVSETENTALSLGQLFKIVWVVGSVGMGLWLLWVNGRLARQLRRSRRPYSRFGGTQVYVAEGIPSPCLYGLIFPAIYLTEQAAADPARAKTVILHEQTHRHHLDHIWTALRVLCLVVYWFDPFVWLAAALSRRDCELFCDAATVKTMGEEHRYDYGRTLLDMTAVDPSPRGLLSAATTMTGSRKAISERIRRIAERPKASAALGALALCIAALAVGCTFSGAADDAQVEESNEYYDYLMECFSAWETGAEERNEYIWFYNDYDEQVSTENFILLESAAVWDMEQVNDSLWAFLVELQFQGQETEQCYYFVGQVDGRLYVFLNAQSIPETLGEGLNPDDYSLLEDGEIMLGSVADSYWDTLSSLFSQFYDPVSVQINVPADYVPASEATGLTLEELIFSTDSFLFESFENGSVTIDESAAALILTGEDAALYFLPDTDEMYILSTWDVTMRVYSETVTGWELVDAVLDWARGLAAEQP